MTYPSVPVVPSFKSVIGYQRNAQKLLGLGDLRADAWGIQKVSLPYSIFHGMWTYDIPPSMWHMYENGVQVFTEAKISSIDGTANLSTVSLNDSALLVSRTSPRYQPNRGHLYSTALWMPNKTAAGVRDFGLFTVDNGVFFRLKSDGNLYAVLRRGGVEVIEELIDLSGLTDFDVEKNNIYDIQFQWRSAGNYYFYIGDPAIGASRLVHAFNFLGTLTSASLYNPAMPCAYKVTQLGSAAVVMRVGCADVTSENGAPARLQYGSHMVTALGITGTADPVVCLHNPELVSGQVNTRDIELSRVSITADKKGLFSIYLARSAPVTGGSFGVIGSGSFIEANDAPVTFDLSVSRLITRIPTQANVSVTVNNPFQDRIDFPIVPGDYLVVVANVINAAVECAIEWGEQI